MASDAVVPLRKVDQWKAFLHLPEKRFDSDPNIDSSVNTCEAYLIAGNFPSFTRCLDKLLAVKPSSPEILRLRAMHAETVEDYQGAIAIWHELAKSRGVNPLAQFRVARIYLKQQSYLRFEKQMRFLRTAFPSVNWLQNRERKFYEILNRMPIAAISGNARTLMASLDWPGARAEWELLYLRSNNDPAALIQVCTTHLEENNHRASLEIIVSHVGAMKSAKSFGQILRRSVSGLISDGQNVRDLITAEVFHEIPNTTALALLRAVLGQHNSEETLD